MNMKTRNSEKGKRRPVNGRRTFEIYLVGARGFEPPTSRSRTERSTRLSHAPK